MPITKTAVLALIEKAKAADATLEQAQRRLSGCYDEFEGLESNLDELLDELDNLYNQACNN